MNKKERFKEIYLKYHLKVKSILFSITRSYNVEDLSQEVFIKIWKNQDQFRGESKISTWIYKIAVSTAYDQFRKNRRQKNISIEKIEELKVPSFGSHVENRDLVQYGLMHLKEKHRVVVGLHYLEGFSLEEISVLESVSLGTIKSRLFYAKKKLTEIFSKNGVHL